MPKPRPSPRRPAVRSTRPVEAVPDTTTKAADSMVCDDCGVVQHGGRWHWGAPALGAVHGGVCPACRRVRERRPAGTLRIPLRLVGRSDELFEVVRSAAAREREEHPLERLVDVVERDGELVVTTTGIHLVRSLIARLEHLVHERPTVQYGSRDEVTVVWPEAAGRPPHGAHRPRGGPRSRGRSARGS